MMRRYRPASARGYQAPDQELDALVLRIRRLAAHRGYDRRQVGSPLLRRLMPLRRLSGGPAAETAELRHRLSEAGLDGNTLAYLIETVETELDYARLRLT